MSISGTRDNQQGTVITVNETDTLKGLIEKARRDRGASARQLAKQAQDAGFKIVGTTLNAIENGTYKSRPSDDTIRAIGWLAGASDDVAFTAAGRRNPGPPFANELPPGVDDLSPAERGAALAVLRTLVAQRQELNRYEDSRTQGTPDDATAGRGAGVRTPTTGAAGRGNVTPLNRRNPGDDLDRKRAASDRVIETEDNTPGE